MSANTICPNRQNRRGPHKSSPPQPRWPLPPACRPTTPRTTIHPAAGTAKSRSFAERSHSKSWLSPVQTEAEVEVLRSCIRRGSSFRDQTWLKSSAIPLGLASTLRTRVPTQKARGKDLPLLAVSEVHPPTGRLARLLLPRLLGQLARR